ncbi:MAG TPA: DoxX family protein [Kiritimatiellia bacterium]|nr:DoxX family protein [Kiritimatiellia bacterium]
MSKISKYILGTDNDVSSLVLRFVLGGVMFPHGAQKLFGWFGGYGFGGTMGYFTETLGIPAPFGFLAIMAESLGALALMAGLLTRITAFGIGAVMAVAAATVHLEHGFFMNWSGQQAGEGFEFHILAAGIAVALMIKGGGRYAVDRIIQQKLTDSGK